MFVCQLCGVSVPPRTPVARVITRQRVKQYPHRSRANTFFRPDNDGKRKAHHTDDPGGTGWEIAAEARACAAHPPDG